MHALLLRRGVGASSARRLASQLSRRGCATKTSLVDRFALLSVDRRFDLDGKQTGALDLPGIGSVGGLNGEPGDSETFYSFTSFNQPGAIYRLDVETGERTVFAEPEVAFEPEDYRVEQVFYPSKDGTRVLGTLRDDVADLDEGPQDPTRLPGRISRR